MYDAERTCAAELARKAGAAVMVYYEEGAEVAFKERREPVTEADVGANRVILAGLAERFPDDAVLSEESADDRTRLDQRRLWVVDPLDGTKEFVDRVGQFAVMIALVVDHEPVVGAVYQPVTDRLWLASKGDGAVLIEHGAERRLSVSARTRAEGLRLVVTRSHSFKGIEAIQDDLGITELKRIGSVGLKVGAIAADEADLYVHISNYTKEWDACAPDAILREAGGVMTDLFGEPLTYNRSNVRNTRGLMASNGLVHEEVVAYVRPWVKMAGLG